jgi:aspartyl-tRNA(Asn)/glutamyl-tRNA(Gln) amidotransferase subunit A
MLDALAPDDLPWSTAGHLAAEFRAGRLTALDVVEATLVRIRALDPLLNSFTAVTEQRARDRARALDEAHASGKPLGPLAGAPFAVKNLFDISGVRTIAGSKINREKEPARRDAALIERLEHAGAVLVGALNMGEYAYDFTGENIHDGPSRNPHDLQRMTGGSSGGSGGAVAGGLVPLTLGSDTNGSIRVPSSCCGIFGLKPTYGRLSRARTFPFVASLDHVGPMTRSVEDLALAYDALQGFDPDDPACANRTAQPVTPLLRRGAAGLRIAIAGGYFKPRGAEALQAIDRVAVALGVDHDVDIPQAERARSAAFLITASEGASLHLDRLRSRAKDYDPAVRDRLIAGAMAPASLVVKAHKFRRWYGEEMLKLFADIDVILAPATPCVAPLIGQQTFMFGDQELPVRANLGIYTQPISFMGLPVVAVPIPLSPMPIAVQIIAAPWREDIALRVAYTLEADGVAAAPRPTI